MCSSGRPYFRRCVLSLVVVLVQLRTCAGAPYVDMTYDEMVDQLHSLASDAPEFVRLFSGNKEFGVKPAEGRCGVVHSSCVTWIVAVARRKDEHKKNAEVFLSGALHGDERVGPLASLASLRLLALGAQCHHDQTKCHLLTDGERQYLTPERRKWLALLAESRTVYASPATNAYGFAKRTRTENGIDPNRDFPIDTSPLACMKSQTAKVVNELFRRHVFQIAVTFHGGMRTVAYEWGAPTFASRDSRISPDESSQSQVSKLLANAAGSFRQVPKYAVDRMNSIVYPVHGGMEDWAYAGSWSGLGVRGGCRTKDYDPSRTASYSNSSLRAFAVLVETSDKKSGPESDMGTEQGVFDPRDENDGHVSRNVRLALAAIDIVEPYLEWRESPDSARVAWSVGGVARVDDTVLRAKCGDYTRDIVAERIQVDEFLLPNVPVKSYAAPIPRCSSTLELSAVARVDSSWREAPTQAKPSHSPPQTHLANLRTNPDWRHSHNGHVLLGKIEWSTTSTIAVASPSSTAGSDETRRRRLALVSSGAAAALLAWWKRCFSSLFLKRRI